MLVYMRRSAHPWDLGTIPRPPQRALDVVLKMNQSHADACATYSSRSVKKSRFEETLTEQFRREELKSEFLELRSKMQRIYRSWHMSSCDQVG